MPFLPPNQQRQSTEGKLKKNKQRPGPPATADGSSTVAKIAADLRPSANGSAVRTSLVAGGS